MSLASALASTRAAAGATPLAPGPLRPGAFGPGKHWDRYELLEPLGQGGMGEVYKARDLRLGRTVALKFLRGGHPEDTPRFLAEARAQARLTHPNVCQVYETGEVEGRAYIAMQLIAGPRLDQAARTLSLPEKVQAMKVVAEAMHEAHRLGIIHRDLKPSNILVERAPDGRPHPVVMDFGLAREAGHDRGLTATGAVMGTPAYMSPEQARGEVRSLDRRTDVYSLGATLYEILIGAPPFEGPATLQVLERVLHEEPPPPRARVPHLPLDLETIVLKCLDKDPERRYPSARALAEDLGRYLDGEPILGRRPGLYERLVRKARRHRALVFMGAVSLIAILGSGAVGLRSWLLARHERAAAQQRALAAQQLGQDVKEIEWFLRLAYVLPLHDTSAEERLVRGRMSALVERHRGDPAGEEVSENASEGAVQYALGRGHLALHEFVAAREALERAARAGIDLPELHFALGRALGELYQRAVEDTRYGGDPAWRARRQQALAREYLEPALRSLERCRGLRIDSPHYLAEVIAYDRGQYEAAEKEAAQAAAEAPWLYEARKLAGDARYARAVAALERGAYDQARTELAAALAHYQEAARTAHSDAWLHEAIADAWLERAELDRRQGRPAAEAFGQALAAAGESVQAAPGRGGGYRRRALALHAQVRAHAAGGPALARILDQLIAAATQATAHDPRDIRAWSALGYGYLYSGTEALRGGRDPLPRWDQAGAQFLRALSIEPNDPWGLNDLGLVHRLRGQHLQQRGEDPGAEYAAAVRRYQGALALDARYLFACSNLVDLYNLLIDDKVARGRDPADEVQEAVKSGERCLGIDGNFFSALDNVALAGLLHARYLLDAGQDPGRALAGSREKLERSRRINPNQPTAALYLALAEQLEALRRVTAGEDPGPALAAGRVALAEVFRRIPNPTDGLVIDARLRLVEAAWAERQGRPVLPLLMRALEAARRTVTLTPSYGDALEELARVYLRLAEARRPRSDPREIAEGLAVTERALALNPRQAQVHALRGRLLLLQAEMGQARREKARLAEAALARAAELNPLLGQQNREAKARAEALAAGPENVTEPRR